MKMEEEKKCTNWFMRKRGKSWVYGCSILAVSLIMAGPISEVKAEETTQITSSEVLENEVPVAPATVEQEVLAPVVASEPENVNAESIVETTVSDTPVTETVDATVVLVADQATVEAAGQSEAATPLVQDTITEADQEGRSDADVVVSKKTESKNEENVTDEVELEAALVSALGEERKADKETTKDTLASGYQTNLKELSYDESIWEVREDGLYSNAVDKGDNFLFSESHGKNFVFQTDVTFLQNGGAASLLFRTNNDWENLRSYTVNLDGYSHKVKFWRWAEANLIDEKEIAATADNKYNLKVIAADEWISYYVNDVLVANLSDYTLQRNDMGQNTYISDGYFGLLNWNGEMIFQNTFFEELEDDKLPFIEDVIVSSKTGTVETKGQFFPKEVTYIQYVDNAAETVDLSFVAQNADATITVQDAAGNVYKSYSDIPVSVGANYLTVTSQYTTEEGNVVAFTYRVNVHRRQSADYYYNELYRGQYHYSVKDGWANDPNGLVYYNGTYHFFYQFFDDTQWGPMHWAHATSTDLIHWEEQPIAFYPDANGTMFSGCIVVDDKNTTGLFPEGEGGMVALITVNGEGQRIKLAYSTDEGKTWTKSDKIAADWTEDPLNNRDFRDPKVFRWEDKWFMVIAGGPLRIYSSDNLMDWTCETAYADLHTECPDLYPLETEDGSVKWVLSRGGRFYKIGDFREVDGKWAFVPDAEYQDSDEVMNFGKDSYAAMTYYVQDFGSSDNPTIPEIVEVNWMNTWEDYCNLVAKTVGQNFNGTFNLNLTLGLVYEDGKYKITQTPIKAYQDLRDLDKVINLTDIDITEDNSFFNDFSADTYEILSTFRPKAGTRKVGFNLRVGDGEVTKVIYDLATETLSIDRSQSGIILSNQFAGINQQSVKKNADGSIDLHLYVDKASVEVFSKGYTVAGANQIFPAPTSLGLSVLVEGESTKADITVYQLQSIWKDKETVTEPLDLIQASATSHRINVGDTIDLKAYIMPAEVVQDVIWTVSEEGIVSLDGTGNSVSLFALKKGNVTVYARSKENPSLVKTYTIDILENNFQTNLTDLTALAGDWYIDGESLKISNTSANDYYMTADKVGMEEYSLDLDLKYEKGAINIFFASENRDPAFAYAIQFGDNNVIRLYRFFGDTIAEVNMEGTINDNEFHHIKVTKTKNGVKVAVDGVDYMDHQFDAVEDFYNDAYLGLGLWDGAMEVQNFFIKDLNSPDEPDTPDVITSEKELVDPVTGVRVILQKGELAAIVGITVDHKETEDAETPAILGGKDYDLFDIVLRDKDGQAISNTKDALVILPIDAGKEVEKVVYLPNSDQEEILDFTQTTVLDADGNIIDVVVFTAKHFSQYGLVYKESSSDSPAKPGTPDTPDSPDEPGTSDRPDSPVKPILKDGEAIKVVMSKTSKADEKLSAKSVSTKTDNLPQTGDSSSQATVGFGLLTALAGFLSILGFKNRKRED